MPSNEPIILSVNDSRVFRDLARRYGVSVKEVIHRAQALLLSQAPIPPEILDQLRDAGGWHE